MLEWVTVPPTGRMELSTVCRIINGPEEDKSLGLYPASIDLQNSDPGRS